MNKFNKAEFVVGSVYNRNHIYTVEDFRLNGTITDCYRSINLFDDAFEQYVHKTGSVEHYRGLHISEYITVDFDNGSDLQQVQQETARFCIYLEHTFDIDMATVLIYFSGNKGFHVQLPIQLFGIVQPSNDFARICKSVVKDLTKDFSFVDISIYHPTALLRLPNTINGKSGLYKIPLSFDELQNLGIAQIKELARQPRETEFVAAATTVLALEELYKKCLSDVTSIKHDSGNEKPIIHDKMDRIIHGVGEHSRNDAAISLCGTLIERKFSKTSIDAILEMWNNQNQPPLDETELDDLIGRAYNRYSDKRGEPRLEEIFTVEKAIQAYRQYITGANQMKVLTGFPRVDAKIRGLVAGETLCIQGKTGVGKSGFLQNIVQNYAKSSGQPVLFLSMEMPLENVLERAVQIESGITGFQVEAEFKASDGTSVPEAAQLMATRLPNLYWITKAGLTLEAIKCWIEFAEEQMYHKKTGLVAIDYIGLIKSKGSNLYEQVSAVARGMKELAKELAVPVIFLSQVNKSKTHTEELDLNSARDSGSIAEASDYVLSLWEDADHPNEQPELLNLIVGITKNRKGGKMNIPFTMNRKSLKFSEASRKLLQS